MTPVGAAAGPDADPGARPDADPGARPGVDPGARPDADPGARPAQWYLGFDCATKTFAFSLARVDLGAFAAARPVFEKRVRAVAELLRRARSAADSGDLPGAARIVEEVAPVVAALDAESASWLRLAAGGVADLCPGQPDREIPTAERMRATARYVRGPVAAAVDACVPPGEAPKVIVEYQMGANSPARAVAAGLLALYSELDTIVVGPTLKNKVATCEEGKYCYFAANFSTTYGANKAHTKYNFARVEKMFGSGIPETRPPSLRGHIADSFMQVLGHLVHGGPDEVARERF